MHFKVVSICLNNPLVTPKAIKFSKALLGNTSLDEFESFWDYILMQYYVSVSASNPELNDSFRRDLSIDIHDFVILCAFNQKDCNYSNFRVSY